MTLSMKWFIGLFALVVSVHDVAQAQLQGMTDPVKIFEQGYVQVVGISAEGQTRYQALRAAQVVAQRDLLEVIKGLSLFGTTSIKDGMLQSDDIKTSVEGFLKGAISCGQNYYESKGYAEVCMRLNIRGNGGLYDVVIPLLKDEKLMPDKKPEFEMPQPKTAQPHAKGSQGGQVGVQAAGVAPTATIEVKAPSQIENPHDGLIIDVRTFQFRPALVNRIVTEKNEIVFEPSKIQSNVLVERGCGGFTTDDSKAKALLESWGSKNPMVVNGIDVDKLTDAKISQDDAAMVYVNDKVSDLLAKARVVFILK